MSTRNIAWILLVTGVALNIADAYTAAGDPNGGYFFGTNGLLAATNALPIQFGLLLILAGAGLLLWQYL